MRVSVDAGRCMGNGLCESVAPDVFEVGEDALAHVVALPGTEAAERAAREAVRMCPMGAIEVEDRP